LLSSSWVVESENCFAEELANLQAKDDSKSGDKETPADGKASKADSKK